MPPNTLLNQLQPFMRKSKVYKEIFEAESDQFANRDALINDLRLQMSVDTATWGLAIYEQELTIPISINKPYSERRSVIKSKMRGTGKVDAALIKLVADSFSNGDVDVSFDSRIRITFTNVVGTPPNMIDLQQAIDEIKPAHLAVIYTYRYNQYQNLAAYTHGYLQRFTHGEINSSALS